MKFVHGGDILSKSGAKCIGKKPKKAEKVPFFHKKQVKMISSEDLNENMIKSGQKLIKNR